MAMVNWMMIQQNKRQKPVPSVMNKHPHIGIELEFDTFKPNPLKWYKDKLMKWGMWHFAHVDQNRTTSSLELNMLTTERTYVHEIGQMVDIIRDGAGFVDDRCELHIHIDCRHRNRMDVYNTLVDFQDVLFSIAHENQIMSPFCIPNIPGIDPWKNSAIYPSDKQETVEVRLFEATLDVDKLVYFVNTVVGIVNFNNALQETSANNKE